MIKVLLNNGTLLKFEECKYILNDGHLEIKYLNINDFDIVYKVELKKVYRIAESIKGCTSLERVLYRGYLLKRGIDIKVKIESIIDEENVKGGIGILI